MWHQWFNRNVMKLREYFLCAKKTKIITLKSLMSIHKVFSQLHKITVEPVMSHGLFYQCPDYLSGPWTSQFHCCLCRVRKLSDLIKTIIILGFMGLEWHEDEQLTTELKCCVNYPFKKLQISHPYLTSSSVPFCRRAYCVFIYQRLGQIQMSYFKKKCKTKDDADVHWWLMITSVFTGL